MRDRTRRSRLLRLLGAAWLAAAVAACEMTTGADLRAPVAAIPADFSASGTAERPDRWWRSLDDPVLEELIAEALNDNLGIRSAWDRLVQAEATARKAGAALLPTVDGALNMSGSRQKSTTSSGRQLVESESALTAALGTSYEVDLWGRIGSTRDAAELDARASAEDLKTAALTLSAEVARTWYQLVESQGQLDLLRGQLETSEQVLEVVTLRFRRGQVSASDVLQQRQQVEANRGDIVAVEAQIEVLRHTLAVLLGQAPTMLEVPRVNALVTLPPLPETGVPGDLLVRRPDLRRAYFQVLAADERTAAAIADRFPRLTLTADVSASGEVARDLFSNWLGTLAAGLTAPIFDGGSRAAEVERTRAVTSEALNDYGAAFLDSLAEVEDALAQEAAQRRVIESLERQLELSDQAFDRIRDAYISGGEDYLRVLDALLTQQSLERSHLEAQRRLIEYRIDLYRALAGGWEMERPAGAGLAAGPGATETRTIAARQRGE